MTYNEFKNKYNGKYVDYDGAYGCQCWDLGQKYFTECLKVPASVLGGCGLVSNMLYPPKRQQLNKYFEETKEPKQGDVAIWEYGHIAIYDHKNYYFSQNPNPAKVIKITTGGVHFFKLKSSINRTVSYRVYCKGHWYAIAKDGQTAGDQINAISGVQVRTGAGCGNTSYRVHIKGGKWLPIVTKWDNTDNGYAGIKGKPIDGFAFKSEKGKVSYRVKTKKSGWLSWVSGFDTNNRINGYAGNLGEEITAIQIKIV